MTLANNVLYIKHIRSTNCFYSVGIRVLGRSFMVSHKAYDTFTSVALGVFMLVAPVSAVALEVL